MSGNRLLKRVILTEMRLRFLMWLAALVLFFLVLSAIFFYEWHRYGDVHAEAFGSLLTFFASIVTATVTLVYLHVTRRSLAAAEAAIQLQREQWQMRMTVKPRFWVVKQALDPAGENPRENCDVPQRYGFAVSQGIGPWQFLLRLDELAFLRRGCVERWRAVHAHLTLQNVDSR